MSANSPIARQHKRNPGRGSFCDRACGGGSVVGKPWLLSCCRPASPRSRSRSLRSSTAYQCNAGTACYASQAVANALGKAIRSGVLAPPFTRYSRASTIATAFKCDRCDGPHWTSACPYFKQESRNPTPTHHRSTEFSHTASFPVLDACSWRFARARLQCARMSLGLHAGAIGARGAGLLA